MAGSRYKTNCDFETAIPHYFGGVGRKENSRIKDADTALERQDQNKRKDSLINQINYIYYVKDT